MTARQLQNGQVVATAEFALAAKEHRAAFLNQDPFFPGLDNYADTVEFTATGPVAPLALQQDGFSHDHHLGGHSGDSNHYSRGHWNRPAGGGAVTSEKNRRGCRRIPGAGG